MKSLVLGLVLLLLKLLATFFAMAGTTYAVSPHFSVALISGIGAVVAYILNSPIRAL